MPVEIKHLNGSILFTGTEAETITQAMVRAVAGGAYLVGANLEGAYLRGANLGEIGNWEHYCSVVVPALLTAGGKPLEEVAATWDCHTWENCPLHAAFGVKSTSEMPPLLRAEGARFLMFFDAKLIPNLCPKAAATCRTT